MWSLVLCSQPFSLFILRKLAFGKIACCTSLVFYPCSSVSHTINQGASNKLMQYPFFWQIGPCIFQELLSFLPLQKNLPETSHQRHAKGTADASFSMLRRSPTAVYLLLLPFRESQGSTGKSGESPKDV